MIEYLPEEGHVLSVRPNARWTLKKFYGSWLSRSRNLNVSSLNWKSYTVRLADLPCLVRENAGAEHTWASWNEKTYQSE